MESSQIDDNRFVGRSRELELGLRALEDALGGKARLLLVAGEAGIGKSRLADELAARAAERGVHTAWGRCWEAGGAPAYWPWVQALRSIIRTKSADQLRAHMGAGAVDIAQMLPEIRSMLGDLPDVPALEPDAERFRVFDSVTTFLRNCAGACPEMMILDDLQVADTPSLLLLQFLAGAMGDGSLLVVATYRDTDLTPGRPLQTALSALTREQAVRRIALRGWAEDDIADFIATVPNAAEPSALARAVHDETDGNPLFVVELIRLLAEEGRLHQEVPVRPVRFGTPRSVRDVIWQRLQPLSEESLHVLTLASVLGREFNLEALSRLGDRSLHQTLEALEEPLAARILIDVPGVRTRLRFSHVVIREALYDEIGRTRRAQLHRAAGHVLETVYAADIDSHLAELAHHFFDGAMAGGVDKAFSYARRAGEQAVGLLAYEEAVGLLHMALEAHDMTQEREPRERCELLLALGDAQARAGDEPGSRATLLQAASAARLLSLPQHLATAALTYAGRTVWKRAAGDPNVVALLQDGLEAIGTADSILRARMLARLGGAMRDDPSPEPRESLAKEAVAVARRIGDPTTLAYALEGLWAATWAPDTPEERLRIADEVTAVARAAGDRERELSGHNLHALAAFELGDMAAVYAGLDFTESAARELRQPAQSWYGANRRSMLSLFEGRFGDTERLIAEAHRMGDQSIPNNAAASYALHLFQLRREQGRIGEAEELIQQGAREFVWYPMFKIALALLYRETGREREARMTFDAVAAGGFAMLPRDNEWIFGMSLAAEVAHLLRDAERAPIIYEQLEPYTERNAYGADEGCLGSVSRYLGLMAATMHRFDDAVRHFECAIARNGQMGARPWVAHAQYDLAVTLATRPDGRNEKVAAELLREALLTCEQLGMPALRANVAAALRDLGAAALPGPSAASHEDVAAAEQARFWLEGEYWTISYEGRLSRLRDSKGLRVLAELLAHPGRPFASLELERLGAAGDENLVRAAAAGDAGEILDDEASRAYRARLMELREEIDEADAWGKSDEAGALREEMEFITAELGRALGLGGRSRRAGSVTERARLNVTRALRASLQRIAEADSALGDHLNAAVRTGTVCEYAPDPLARLRWHVSPPHVG